MESVEHIILERVVGNYARTGSTTDDEVTVVCIPKWKSSAMEKVGGDDRTIMLDEYRVGEKAFRVAYSSRSNTVYISES
ncbi:hypothetical protein MASR2M66_09380 [Chloroflexota bacterium]